MEKEYITKSSEETKKLGKKLAEKLKGGEIIALTGELGSGKTTFTQGFLKGLGAKGPYTSPTFLIMKKYQPHPALSLVRRGIEGEVYHFDVYRVKSEDIINLGWEEIIADDRNVIIIEWADRIKDIIPDRAIWIELEWVDDRTRQIKIKNFKVK